MATTGNGFAVKVAAGLSVLFLIVILLGGCMVMGCFSGSPSPAPEEPPTTETPTTTTPNTTTEEPQGEKTYNDVQLPDGVTTKSIETQTLLNQHNSILKENSYQLGYTYTQETSSSSFQISETVYKEGNNFYITRTQPSGNLLIWANSDSVYKRTSGADTTYSVSKRTEYSVSPDRVDIRQIFDSGKFEATGTVTRNNETFVTFESTSASVDADEVLSGNGVSNYNASVVISPDGFVKGFQLKYTTQMNGEQTSVSLSGLYESVGSTQVTEPGWTDEADSQHAEIGTHAEPTYISLIHRGGSSIDIGTTIEIQHNGETHEVTTQSTMNPGDVLYVYQRSGEYFIGNEVPDGAQQLESGDYVFTGYDGNAELFKAYLLSDEEQ